jgi:monoamine oxidase
MKRRAFLEKSLGIVPSILLSSSLLQACGDDVITPTGKTVLVIGAGAAGLGAAKKLKEKGFSVIVLEAQDKAGGRIRSNRSQGFLFEEGASWIHGTQKNNPLLDLAKNAGATTVASDFDNMVYFDTNGSKYAESIVDKKNTELDNILASLSKSGAVDKSFESVFDAKYPNYLNDRLWKHLLSANVEFDYAPLAELSSLDYDDDDSFTGDDLIITNGYDNIINYLSKDLDLRLNERVNQVEYSGAKAKVTTNTTSYEADYVIVTVPLGVLKKNVVNFSPALPSAKQQAINKLGMNVVNKFILTWDTPFWDNTNLFIGYTPETRGKFNYFVNVKNYTPSLNALMTFAVGKFGLASESLSDAAVIQQIMEHLRAIYGSKIPAPKTMLRTKWGQNPNAYGAYSFVATNARSTEFEVLQEAVDNKLFFAGEHTIKNHRASVHGAYLSGIREADKIIAL